MSIEQPEETAAEMPDASTEFISRDEMGLAVPFAAPESETESMLAEIWSSVLSIKPIGIDDDFFELGGDSFAATVVAGQIEATLNVQFSPGNIIHHSTVRDQATQIGKQASAGGGVKSNLLVAHNADGTRPPFFLLHGAAGYVLFGPEFLDTIGADQPVYMAQAPGMDGRDKPCETVEEFAETYIREMRKIQPQGPYRIGATCTGSFICLEMCNQLAAAGEDVEKLILLDPPLMIADNPFPKLESVSDVPQFPRRLSRWMRRGRQKLLSRVELFDHLRSERKRMKTQKRLQDLYDQRQKAETGTVTEVKGYQVSDMMDVSLKLHEAVNAYEVKSYDGHADMLITQKRAINAKEGSFYHGRIKSISAEIVPSSHKNLFIGDIGLVAKFIKKALHS